MRRSNPTAIRPVTVRLMILGLSLLITLQARSQTDENTSQSPVPPLAGVDNNPPVADKDTSDGGDRMLTPPPVSGERYPIAPASQERSNYLRGGLIFMSAYSDNVLGSAIGYPVSDISYSVGPSVVLDTSGPREHLMVSYAPGFTFYRRTSARNEADQNAAVDFQFRLSPHVTFTARDSFQKSSNVFNQPDLGSSQAVSGSAEAANFSVIAPLSDQLSNFGNAGLTYQFSRNGMVGASGTFSNLQYSHSDQVPGLYNSSSQGGSAFFSFRISKMHYLGGAYEYQRLVSYPSGSLYKTQTDTLFLFYTLYPTSRFSISFFGGPQYSNAVQPSIAPLQPQPVTERTWNPAAGASFNWQGRLSSFAVSYSHTISGGGGLLGAVHMDNASASLQQRITRSTSGSLSGAYVQNQLLAVGLSSMTNGHTISATASLQRQFGAHLNLQLGYTRIHQDYSGVAVLALTPDTNREFASISYQFSRPLGR